jgi:hypothetical protein
MSNKELVSKMYEELTCLNGRKTNKRHDFKMGKIPGWKKTKIDNGYIKKD